MRAFQAVMAAPCCKLGIKTCEGRITEIVFLPQNHPLKPPENPLAREACRQLAAYFADPGHVFELPLEIQGTPFRRRVWAEIAAIPRGKTATYGEIASRLSSSARAVGQACGANPFPIVIPCHRVLAKGGIGGFMHRKDSETLAVKEWLLRHEGF